MCHCGIALGVYEFSWKHQCNTDSGEFDTVFNSIVNKVSRFGELNLPQFFLTAKRITQHMKNKLLLNEQGFV